jgi:hypothetical protein
MTPTSDPSPPGEAEDLVKRLRTPVYIDVDMQRECLDPDSTEKLMREAAGLIEDLRLQKAGLEALLVDAQEEIAELKPALKAALDILGHPDDATVQALRAILRKWNT